MPVQKIKSWQQNQQINLETKRGYHSMASIMMTIMALSIMLYLTIRHFGDEGWGYVTLLQFFFGLTGYIFMQIANGQGLFPKKEKRIKFTDDSPMVIVGQTVHMSWIMNFGIALVFGLGATYFGQRVMDYYYSIEMIELAFYTIFASVCEELFFRGMIMELFLSSKGGVGSQQTQGGVRLRQEEPIWKRVSAILISASTFAYIHFNYHNSLPTLATVFIMGLIIAFDYAVFRNITAVIFLHFILNIMATKIWLLQL